MRKLGKEWVSEVEGEYTPLPDPDDGKIKDEHWLPLILSRRQVVALLESPASVSIPVRTALRSLYASGMRPEEVVGLAPSSLDAKSGSVQLGPDRAVVVDPVTMELLVAALPWTITLQDLQDGLEALARESGVMALYEATRHLLLPKALRHAFATHCLENGMDLFALHKLLGLRWVSTTEMYIETAIAHWRPAYDRYHPLVRKQEKDDRGGGEHAPITPDDVESMIAVSQPGRDQLTVQTIYSSALREEELTNLKFADFVYEERRIWVRRGKDYIDRYTVIDAFTADELRKWQGSQPASARPFPVSTREVARTVAEAATKAGLRAKYPLLTIAPHTIRHAYGNHCYHNGIDLFALEKLLGHRELENTLIYVNCDLPEWRKAYDRSHPFALG